MEEINNFDELVSKLTKVSLPREEFAPPDITNWLNTFSNAHGTNKELALCGILPTVGALLARTGLKLFSIHRERGNMFVISLPP